MKPKNLIHFILVLVFLFAITPIPASAGLQAATSTDTPQAKIDSLILTELEETGQTNLFIKMASDANLDAAEGISDRNSRLQFVYDTLTTQATLSQKSITRFLSQRGVTFESFWINNSIYVYAANQQLVDELAKRSDVAYLRADHQVPLHLPVKVSLSTESSEAVEWNIQTINADDVWNMGITGQGVVVANIDTGVRYTHEAIVSQYRGNNGDGTFSHDYNWFDPTMALPAPADAAGHGTHTMGTMVGGDGLGPLTNDIGVAPGAQWIAAKGCGLVFCSEFALTASAQWIACPTQVDGSNPDCTKAPNIVNNSWGGGGGDPWYNTYVRSWLAAGIVPVFSIGNSGPQCGTAGSPGDYSLVFGVGATNINDVLASFSSKGPGTFRALKPDFVAPGDNVRSAYNSGDSAYAVFSGTSMAAPHVSGTIALLLSAAPNADLRGLYNALRLTTVTALGVPPAPTTCGGRPYNVYPNAIYGWGRIDAFGAVEAITP